MKIGIFFKSIAVLLFLPFLTQAQIEKSQGIFFEGSIQYKSTFTDLQGKDITKKAASFFDTSQTFYVDEENYITKNGKKEPLKLFQGKYNAYFYFNKDKTAYKIDQTTKTSQRTKVYAVEDVDTILGYPCHAVKVDADFRAYIYFFSDDLKIDHTPYAEYNMEEWNVYLKASQGSLPLRVITIDVRNKMIEDKIAVRVVPEALAKSTFDFPKDIKLRGLKYGIDLIW